MSYYGGTITVLGRNLITSLMAGEKIEFTRILVGSGAMPGGMEPIDMTALVEPVAEAVSTVPTIENNVLSMIVEYRNDLNGGLQEGFWLREFGVFARTENTEEVLLYYATLGDSPQPVNAFKDNRIDIRRYPITIALELDADVEVAYNPGAFMTSGEAAELVEALVNERLADLKGNLSGLQEDLSGFKQTVGEELQDLNDTVSRIPVNVSMEITISIDGWTVDEGVGGYHADITDTVITAASVPILTVWTDSLDTAQACGMLSTVMTMDGALRVYTRDIPEADIQCSVTLIGVAAGASGGGTPSGDGNYVLPTATQTRLGGVKIGDGVIVRGDGTISVDSEAVAEKVTATPDEVQEMLKEVYGET